MADGALVERVIALDGPSGSGKSTVARGVARALGWRYLDTGATYRAATAHVLRTGTDPADAVAVARAVAGATIEVGTDPDAPWIRLDGDDVGTEIRGPAVTGAVSAVSAVPAVRAQLVALQRSVVGAGEAVVEGRDICAVVTPAAKVKVYLDADPEVRAARRAADVDAGVAIPAGAQGAPALAQAVRADLERRDALDSGRSTSPLAAAPDAQHVDATLLDADAVIARVLELARAAGFAPPAP
jgi:cytidylate kinase